jgi:hypothetical protein
MKSAVIIAAALALLSGTSARTADYETVWVDPGNSVDVYWEINLKGKVYVAADIDGQPACLDYWWIVLPFTQINKLGNHCGRASFDIPSWSDFSIGGKLRAGNAKDRTRVLGTSNERVAATYPVKF